MASRSPDLLLTPNQMARADQLAMESGIKTLRLMDAVGKEVTDARVDNYYQRSVRVLCGPGNDGGEWFVVADLLKQCSWPV